MTKRQPPIRRKRSPAVRRRRARRSRTKTTEPNAFHISGSASSPRRAAFGCAWSKKKTGPRSYDRGPFEHRASELPGTHAEWVRKIGRQRPPPLLRKAYRCRPVKLHIRFVEDNSCCPATAVADLQRVRIGNSFSFPHAPKRNAEPGATSGIVATRRSLITYTHAPVAASTKSCINGQ